MASEFDKRVAAAMDDVHLRTTLTRSYRLLKQLREQGLAGREDWAELRAEATAIRRRTLAHLPALLEQLQAQVMTNGGHVYWAEDAAAANRYIVALAQARDVKRVVRSRSATAEEIGLDAAIEAAGLRVTDTSLGDYVLQLAGEPSSHPVFPALHKRKEDVAGLFEQKLDMPETLNIQGMAGMARYKLRKELFQAGMSISGVNFAVAETGTLAVATDSGSDCYALALAPQVHIALMGIEKVVPTLEDLFLLLEALALSAAGQPLTNYVNLLNRPARAGEANGPAELHLVILDNGRSNLLNSPYQEALACIRCGACANVCPVYREIGGHTYGSPVHTGPIGAVVLPLLPAPAKPGKGRTEPAAEPRDRHVAWPAAALKGTPFAELPYASTLCGACAEVCPVGIDIPGLLLRLRGDLAAAGRLSLSRRLARRLDARAMGSAGRSGGITQWFRRGGSGAGLPGASDGPGQLAPAKRSFKERWEARNR